MEEQRARQQIEGGGEKYALTPPATPGRSTKEALLQRALAMAMTRIMDSREQMAAPGAPNKAPRQEWDPATMTEEEHVAYAIQSIAEENKRGRDVPLEAREEGDNVPSPQADQGGCSMRTQVQVSWKSPQKGHKRARSLQAGSSHRGSRPLHHKGWALGQPLLKELQALHPPRR